MSRLTHVMRISFRFVPAIILFVLDRDGGPFVRNHVVTEWYFHLTALIVQVVCAGIAVVGSFSSFAAAGSNGGSAAEIILFFIGYRLIWVVMIFEIIASVAANRGRFYRYPLAIRFVKERRVRAGLDSLPSRRTANE